MTMSNHPEYRGGSSGPGIAPPTPLLYSLIARGTTVLARQAACAGNFSEVTEQILSKIPPGIYSYMYMYRSV